MDKIKRPKLNLFMIWTIVLALCAMLSLVSCGRTNVYDNLIEAHHNKVDAPQTTDVINDSGKESFNEGFEHGYAHAWDENS